ncbi:ribosomal protein L7Ae-like RNA K-turn-binding protein [Entomoplasma freundtii]|uniref:50S ribosomal protein L7ae n=1 Tax=Entomoplasma freundtii TaxID=74700 RepID=A0A2K8NRP6_9MOLU|nr:ribosomal L7Ae/L30e/S12e/Gadd45 family protein [Entomoplasma freundtii]ATZ16479.1 50S ribosomal protein L7ae [Entomoplasma freundtii]TDY56008.1 ribosomal protein L7Ae-like RNA K-turn-binding protein [Entomoplasma freundtii]
MDHNKVQKALGLAKGSNKLIYGYRLFSAFATMKLRLVIIAHDMGPSQKEKLINQCLHYKVPYDATNFSREELAHATGMKTLVAVGVEDENIYQLIKKYF